MVERFILVRIKQTDFFSFSLNWFRPTEKESSCIYFKLSLSSRYHNETERRRGTLFLIHILLGFLEIHGNFQVLESINKRWSQKALPSN